MDETAKRSPTMPCPSSERPAESGVESVRSGVSAGNSSAPSSVGIAAVGELTDRYEAPYGRPDEYEKSLAPKFAEFAHRVRVSFEDFLALVDSSCKVTWQPALGGFVIVVFGMCRENASLVCAAIANQPGLLEPSDIYATLVSATEVDSGAIRVFVPYDGALNADGGDR
jgi:hypothetical protein